MVQFSGLSNQESAKKGNWYGVIGMMFGVALATVDAWHDATAKGADIWKILGTIVLMIIPGASIGVYVALRVVMTAMPELIACLHSFVGLAATLIGYGSFFNDEHAEGTFNVGLQRLECFLGIFIGAVTFTGSLIAFGKLNGKVPSKPYMFGGKYRMWINGGIIGISLVCMMLYMYGLSWGWDLMNLTVGTVLSLVLGVVLIMAIGGADMPVVISMLNSYSGWATAMSGLMLSNMVMVVTGALVGSSGAILSYIMCRAMNRSFISVILGGFGEGAGGAAAAAAVEGEMKEIQPMDAAQLVAKSKSIIIVPGYGMAAGKAQHAVAAITKLMRKHGCNLRFAVHPVAGRLPGHMNVLLAEARVPYDIVMEMEKINPDFPSTDLAIVLGANDIVNPSALDDPNSPIAGMPVVECWKAKNVIVIKRGKGTGYAGVENPLFYKENTRMLYGNALAVCEKMLANLTGILGDSSAVAAAAPKVDETTPLKQEEKAGYQTQEKFPDPVHFVGVPKEVFGGERRVAATPESVVWMRKMGFGVYIESGAGEHSRFSDEDYVKVGATICPNAEELYKKAEIVLKVRPPQEHPVYKVNECQLMRQGTVILSYLYPARNGEVMKEMEKAGVTAIAMDQIPRISRAQKCDVLSSMAGISGYRAVIEAASYFPRYMTGQITAAGSVKPAKVLIVGAGVAGLAAIGAAKGLGAIVRAFDSRVAVQEQIESMGGEFLTVSVKEDGEVAGGYSKAMSEAYVREEIALFTRQAEEVDIIITTAQIPNKKAPVLVTAEAVSKMKAGSVIVDLAAETGGNCELTVPGKTIDVSNGVKIVGETDLVGKMATQASTMYSNNLCHLLDEMGKAQNFSVDEKNEIIYGSLCVIQGKIRWDPNRKPVSVTAQKKPAGAAAAGAAKPATPAAPVAAAAAAATEKKEEQSLHAPAGGEEEKKSKGWFFYFKWTLFVVFVVGILILAVFMTTEMLNLIVIFVFAIYIGFMVIWNVTPSLHTPLMSVTNAVSGIIICGGIVELTAPFLGVCFCVGAVSVFLASINVFGGFIVTHRMLQMFVMEKKMN